MNKNNKNEYLQFSSIYITWAFMNFVRVQETSCTLVFDCFASTLVQNESEEVESINVKKEEEMTTIKSGNIIDFSNIYFFSFSASFFYLSL